jgi:hypothetical protein
VAAGGPAASAASQGGQNAAGTQGGSTPAGEGELLQHSQVLHQPDVPACYMAVALGQEHAAMAVLHVLLPHVLWLAVHAAVV